MDKNIVLYALFGLMVLSSFASAAINVTSAVSYLNDALDAFSGVASHFVDFVVAWLPVIVIGLIVVLYKEIISTIGSWIKGVM